MRLQQSQLRDEQHWYFINQRQVGYVIANYRNPNFVMDVPNSEVQKGRAIQLYLRSQTNAQRFLPEYTRGPQDQSVHQLRTTFAVDRVITATGYDSTLVVGDKNNTDRKQKFRFIRTPEKGFNVYQIIYFANNQIIAWNVPGGIQVFRHQMNGKMNITGFWNARVRQLYYFKLQRS
ncbi:hypothetical protein ACFFW8_16545 [Erwinia tracheiphila]